MAAKRSAGILLYCRHGAGVEVLLAHMGGPFFQRRDAGAWTIPKGEHGAGEDPWEAARREFTEELGLPAPPGDPVELNVARQAGGKLVQSEPRDARAKVVSGQRLLLDRLAEHLDG